MQQESKALGILAIVFGAIALVGSWIPIINNLSFLVGILGLVLGVIGLIVNRKKQKTLAIIGSIISVLSLIIVIATQSFYSRAIDEAGKSFESAASSVSSSIESSQKEEDAKFTWTKEQFDALKEGDIANNGAGGTKYDDVIRDHGKPNDENTTSISDHESKTITYTSTGSKFQSVILTFAKQEDGSFLLTVKISNGLE
ncbi:CD20-like domain-containing protein [Streptococcus cristatus]|uniref:CD20-like domain-containing protein n=1 Tax=Streptococcus cristatus TaxID=45634 RepID=UPI00065F9037|nr:CD20-like domain-containing protein [Streptococcus cristatus]